MKRRGKRCSGAAIVQDPDGENVLVECRKHATHEDA